MLRAARSARRRASPAASSLWRGFATSSNDQKRHFEDDLERDEYERAIVGFDKLRETGMPPNAVVGSGMSLLDALLDATVYRALGVGVSLAAREGVERSFDRDEFLEGAKDAFWMVSKLIGEGDLETLRPMVSPGIYTAVRREQRVAEMCDVRVRNEPPVDISATVVGMQLWDEAQYERAGGKAPAPLAAAGGSLSGPPPPGSSASPDVSTDSGATSSSSPSSISSHDSSSPPPSASSTPSDPSTSSTPSSGGASGSGPKGVKGALNFATSIESFSALAAGKYLAVMVRFDSTRAVTVEDLRPAGAAADQGETGAPAEDEGAAAVGEAATKPEDAAAAGEAAARPGDAAVGPSAPKPRGTSAEGATPGGTTPEGPVEETPGDDTNAGAASETPRVLARFVNRRPARWVFARGPLPEGLPVRELSVPWLLIEAV